MIRLEININSSKNNYKISCYEFLPENVDNVDIKNVIIACHGFCGDKDSSVIQELANSLEKYNYCVITLDFPGHGKSETDGEYFTLENCVNDFNDVEKYVMDNFKNAEIGLFASSYGAYVVLEKLRNSSNVYNKIVFRCPAINMQKTFEDSILKENKDIFIKQGELLVGFRRMLNVKLKFYDELKKNDYINNYNLKNNILIIHGTEDDMAPIKYSIQFENKFKDKVKLVKIEGADHRFKKPGEIEKVIQIATDYIVN